MDKKHDDLTEILSQVFNDLKNELGDGFDLNKINLAELERRTGVSRARLRHIKANGFTIKSHGLTGRKAEKTVCIFRSNSAPFSEK